MRLISASLVLLAAVACASVPRNGDVDGTAAGGSTQPPQLIRSGPMPEMRLPQQTSPRTVAAHIDLEVMVDVLGNPDMTTFKATGRGAEVNQDVLRTWVAAQRFRPAQRDGQNVPGVFKMSWEARRR